MSTDAGQPFGQLLRRYRKAAGWTQEELATRALLSAFTISGLERGTTQAPRRDTLTLLAEALGLGSAERAALETASRALDRGASPPGPGAGSRVQGPLVGRTTERQMLERHLAGEGPPLLLLAGEPGIGKSRLLEEAARQAFAGGWTVLHGGCRRDGQEPYAPVLGALAGHSERLVPAQARRVLAGCAWLVRLLPELAEKPIEPLPVWTVSPDQERRLMFMAVARYARNVAGPAGSLLLLDDLQWAGQDALDLLVFLARGAAGTPLRIVGAYRDTDVHSQEPLGQLLADLAHTGVAAHRRLVPLTLAEAVSLLDALLPDVDPLLRTRVLERAGGLPFFLVSCAQGLRHGDGEALPWAVEQSIRQRVAALPAGDDEVLAVAAVIGREVPRALLVEVTHREREHVLAACDAACRARLLDEWGTQGYCFVHDAVRELLEADLGAGRRALVHGRIAAALAAAPGEPSVEALAYHYDRAGMEEQALQYLELAGDQAYQRAAHAAAEQHYREVAARLGRGLERARVHEKLAEVLSTTGRYDAALAELAEAAASRQASGDLESLGRIASRMGHSHYKLGTPEEGVARLRSILDDLEGCGPSSALAMAYVALAELNLHGGQWAEEVAAAEQAVRMARLVGDAAILPAAVLLHGIALCMMGDDEGGLRHLLEAIGLAETSGDRETLCQALDTIGWVYQDRGEFQQSGRYLDREIQLAKTTGNPVLLAFAFVGRGLLAWHRGEWEHAQACYEQAAGIHRDICLAPLCCDAGGLLIAMGQLSLQRGAWDQAACSLEQARGIFAPMGNYSGLRDAQGALAELDILAGRPVAARDRLLPLLDRRGIEEHDVSTLVLPVLAWAYLEMAALDQAERMLTHALSRSRAGGYRISLVKCLHVQGLLALRQEQWTTAAASLEEGLAVARAMPYPYGEGRLLQAYGHLHLAQGDAPAAAMRLDQAQAVFARLGAGKDREQTLQLLAATR